MPPFTPVFNPVEALADDGDASGPPREGRESKVVSYPWSSLLLKRIVHNANEFMAQQIEQGEELRHDVLKGVVGYVDGQGQCFIDTRNILNGVHECQKISRNTIINELIDDWEFGINFLV